MSDSSKSVSALRQRMIEDMHMRKLNPKTQKSYFRHVAALGEFLGHSPHTATAEDLRRYQLHMVDSGRASGNINAQLSGLRFFLKVTLDDASRLKRIKRVHQPRTIPQILSREEVTRLVDAADSPKYQAALSVAYGAGLRRNEIVNLKVSDIDSDRMIIRVEQGEGSYCHVLTNVAEHAAQLVSLCHRAQRNTPWRLAIIPGLNLVHPMSARQLARVFHMARDAAGINKKVSLHSLRDAFATHLLESGVDIRVIQVLLGHEKLTTTARYSQVAASTLREVVGPLESLDLKFDR